MGAQFAVDRRLILDRGKSFWEDLYEISLTEATSMGDCEVDNYTIKALFEASWPAIMNYDGSPVTQPASWPSIPIKMKCNRDGCLAHWELERSFGRFGWGVEG
jgi:hypothetical protein